MSTIHHLTDNIQLLSSLIFLLIPSRFLSTFSNITTMPSPIQNPRLLLTSSALLPLKPRPCSHRCFSSLPSLVSSPPASTTPASTIHSVRQSLLSREKSCAQIASEFLERIRLTEPVLKSFVHLSESVMREAEAVDLKVEKGEEVGSLAGVLVAVKDNICTADMPSTGGSRILEGYRPAFDATAVRRLREAGAIIIGKTNLDEFGMGSTTEGSGFHVTKNPWDTTRVPGGSSGGSASSVSARQCMTSLGSDTGGSVRQPASFCGVVGLKPTYGLVSRFGLMAYASSLDVIGVLSNSVVDASVMLGVISGFDGLDSTSSSTHEVVDYAAELASLDQRESKPLKGLRVGIIKETLGEGVEPGIIDSIKNAAAHLEHLGSSVAEVSLPSFDLGLPAYYILASSEASSNLSRYDGVRYGNRATADDLNLLYGDSRANGLGHEVKMRILMGTYALSAGYYDAYYKRAQQVRTLVKKSFNDALQKFDILISPAAPSAAYKVGEKTNDPLSMYAGDIMTVNVNLAGLPSLVVPCGFVEGGPAGLPVGVQMIGSSFSEGKLLRVGHVFEQSLQGLNFVPPILNKEDWKFGVC